MNVICVVLIHLVTFVNDAWTSKEMSGKVIEERGDNWLVDFGSKLELVNSNTCLIQVEDGK